MFPFHLPEYATLKAMGYSDRYLIGVLLQEALILAILGFIPEFTISLGLYGLIAKATLLPVQMTLNRARLVLFLTVVMCVASGAIAPGVSYSLLTLPIFSNSYSLVEKSPLKRGLKCNML